MLPADRTAGHPARHSLSEWLDSTRDQLPNPARAGGCTSSSDCNARRSEPPYGKGDCVDQGELREAPSGGRSRKNRGYGAVYVAQSFPSADRNEPTSVSK